ncbi:hypothetical protein STEG23_017333, partial [Scotinomys teguina]
NGKVHKIHPNYTTYQSSNPTEKNGRVQSNLIIKTLAGPDLMNLKAKEKTSLFQATQFMGQLNTRGMPRFQPEILLECYDPAVIP